jgi:hypothetical protein
MEIDSQWWRCLDGYRLKRTERRRVILPGGKSRPFTDEEEARSPYRREEDRYSLWTASSRHEEYRPLEIPGLYSIFADAPATPEGMRLFANRFGLLTFGEPHINPGGAPKAQMVPVSDMLAEHWALRQAIELHTAGRDHELARYWNARRNPVLAQVRLNSALEGRIEFSLTPPSLVQAMWMQFASDACSGARLYRCERCGKPFSVGTGTGRRNTAKYCSNACKVAVYQQRKRAEEVGP